jgi:DNA-binding CsgD family transcriptional regulator
VNLYQSEFLSIEYREQEKLVINNWHKKELGVDLFIREMINYVETLKKCKAEKIIWNHIDFHFQVPENLFQWIENTINIPAMKAGVKQVGFIIGEDLMAQISTMDVFEVTNSVYNPRFFFDPNKAMIWAKTKQDVVINPFEKEINLFIEKNAEKGSAKIQLDVSIEELPYYLRKVKELMNQTQFANKNYQKYLSLTIREREILNLITKGYSNRKISEYLFISLNTMTTHRRNILKKLDCRTIPDLLKYNLLLHF